MLSFPVIAKFQPRRPALFSLTREVPTRSGSPALNSFLGVNSILRPQFANSFGCHTSENSPVSEHPNRMRVPSDHREARDLPRPLNPLAATLAENHILSPIIATLRKTLSASPLLATHLRPPGGPISTLNASTFPSSTVHSVSTLIHFPALRSLRSLWPLR